MVRELGDSRAIHQIGGSFIVREFYGTLRTNLQVRTLLEKSKETVLEFSKGTANVF